jgi:hypothetical protein
VISMQSAMFWGVKSRSPVGFQRLLTFRINIMSPFSEYIRETKRVSSKKQLNLHFLSFYINLLQQIGLYHMYTEI